MDGLKVITGPSFEPVTLEEAKRHCRVDISDEDTLITGLISAARAYLEQLAGRAFAARTLLLHLSCFPLVTRQNHRGAIRLPNPPLASVTSVQYYDTAGTLQTLAGASYQVDTVREPGEILVVPGGTWPDVQDDRVGAVQVTYVAGVATAGDIDPRVKQAMLLTIGHWYQNRETVLVGTASKEIEHAVQALMFQMWDGRLT